MEISPGLEIIHTALWLTQKKILIINDLHLGYEEAWQRKGILVPKFQLSEIIKELESILEKIAPENPTTVIINGDLKHEFGTVLKQEWKEVLAFLDFVAGFCENIVILRGNHDPLLRFIAEKRGIQVVTEYTVSDILIIHGDEIVDTTSRTGIKRLIIGHEHPAITLKKGSKREKYKCFLKGTWKMPEGKTREKAGKREGKAAKELIAVPSFNPLLEGTDVLKEKLLSPFLEKIADFEVYVVGKEDVFCFGKVGEVGKIVRLK
ncbi:MAG: metallophosphoesterase [Nanoarchaeota archaeon]|mgnify:FL=1